MKNPIHLIFNANTGRHSPLVFLPLIISFLIFSWGSPLAASQTTAEAAEGSCPEDITAVTKHQITVDGKILKYTARAGFLPICDQFGETKARFFYTAYTLGGERNTGQRPVTFIWNGGPGAPSSLLHFSLLGPRRKVSGGNSDQSSSYPVVDNNETLLPYTDLVMVDPIGTGYSHPLKPEDSKLFWGVSQDLDSISEFIRIYLTHYDILEAPIFLIGESYGTFRAAGVAEKLVNKEYSLMGIVLISTTLKLGSDGDISLALHIPSYTAAAFYHKKLSPELQADIQDTLRQVETWAETEYIGALIRGDRLSSQERQAAIDNFARFTGLDPKFIDKSNLRVEADEFGRQLLSSDNKSIGRYDSRVTKESSRGAYDPMKDPSLISRGGKPFLFVTYLRSELEFRIERLYRGPFGGIWPPPEKLRGDWMAYNWDWGSLLDSNLDQSKALAKALHMKDDLRVLFASGLYDLATPYFVTEHTISHMGLDPKLRDRVDHKCYSGGHMMYQDDDVRLKLMHDIFSFYKSALAK
ncbi:MAG: peptidase S10 [Candidatus Aminicenantes bacterium]|nr:peptidase S10 [Candidatus Aminicenantes bacterium]